MKFFGVLLLAVLAAVNLTRGDRGAEDQCNIERRICGGHLREGINTEQVQCGVLDSAVECLKHTLNYCLDEDDKDKMDKFDKVVDELSKTQRHYCEDRNPVKDRDEECSRDIEDCIESLEAMLEDDGVTPECGVLESSNRCLKEIKCLDEDEENGLEFITIVLDDIVLNNCRPDINDVSEEITECLNHPDNKDPMDECNRIAGAKKTALEEAGVDSVRAGCEAQNLWLSCVVKTARERCGEEAAAFMKLASTYQFKEQYDKRCKDISTFSLD